MTEQLKQIREIGQVPLVVLQDAIDAVPLAKALVKGGIPVAEVTFRTSAAKDSIAAMAEQVPEIILGAGTVHTVDQAKEAVEAGAKFIVTPGYVSGVVNWCIENSIDIIPGITSPSDVERALAAGLTVCKFFPAEAYGGIKTLKALAGPYANVSFLPTGGITIDNMKEYLSLPNVIAVGGSFTAPDQLVRSKDWDGVTAICQKVMASQLGFELAHVGINTDSADAAADLANRFSTVFLQNKTENQAAWFAGAMVEFMKGNTVGQNGHIAINTCDMERAVAYLHRIGVELDEATANYNAANQLQTIYLQEQIGGFGVHLRRV